MWMGLLRTLCACSLLIGPVVSAQTVTPGEPLSLREAIDATLRKNPDLRTMGFSLRAHEARIKTANLRPAPALSVEAENFLGSGDTQGFDAAEVTFALSQVIELGGKRAQRLAVAQSSRDATFVRRQAAQLDVLGEVSRRFVHVAGDQAQLALTSQGAELARQTVAAVKRRVAAAKSPEVELYRANVELLRAELELEHAEHELLVSRQKLAAMWGESKAQFGSIEADLYALPTPIAFQKLAERLKLNPDFTLFAHEARLRDAEMRLAQAQRRPNLQLSAGVRRLQRTGDNAFVLGVSVPLFAGRQAAAAVEEAHALREQVDADREAAFVKAYAQVFELYQELQHAINEAAVLRRDALPQMEKALQETQYAYDRGRYGYLELVEGQRAYLDVQRALIDSAVTAQTLQTEIERLTGEPVSQSTVEALQP